MTTISTHTAEPTGLLAAALLREHHEIDAGIEAFASRAGTQADTEGISVDLAEWAKPLTDAMHALRRHIYLEEVIVFPKIRMGGLMMVVMVMIREHGEIWRSMDLLDVQLAEMSTSQTASGADRTSLARDCRNMLALLDDHNMKEEPVIYPHLDTDLDRPQNSCLRTFCARAGCQTAGCARPHSHNLCGGVDRRMAALQTAEAGEPAESNTTRRMPPRETLL